MAHWAQAVFVSLTVCLRAVCLEGAAAAAESLDRACPVSWRSTQEARRGDLCADTVLIQLLAAGSPSGSEQEDDNSSEERPDSAAGMELARSIASEAANGSDGAARSGDIVRQGDMITGEAPQENLGYDLALSANGQRLLVGAYQSDKMMLNAGACRVYQWSSAENKWKTLGQDVYGGHVAYGMFGASVSLDAAGSRWAAGATMLDSRQPSGSGGVEVFDLTLDIQTYQYQWVRIGSKILGESEDEGARNVGISGDGSYLVIGASGHQYGAVRVYKYDGDDLGRGRNGTHTSGGPKTRRHMLFFNIEDASGESPPPPAFCKRLCGQTLCAEV
ncbi:unnamed protein product, partial [Prorocentrum cordatum]